MAVFLQTLVNGLMLGGLFSLAAVGFSLIFGVMNVINLTHGVMVLIGAYLAYLCWSLFGVNPLVAIPLIMAALFGFGYVYQRGLIQSAIDRSALPASLLVTFGVALMLRNALMLIFSPDFKSISPSYALASINLGPVTLSEVRLIGLAASLVLIAVLAFILGRTEMGRSIRATAQQPLAASLCGVNVRHVYALTFALASAFAGAAGAIVGMVIPFTPGSEVFWTLNAFVVVVLGGVGSPSGALLGGLLLGLANTFTAQYVGTGFTNAMMFLILVLMLLLRPRGLLGGALGESR